MQTKYTAARNVMGFIGIVGWVAFAVGLIVLVMGISNEAQTAAFGVGAGIAVAIGGLIQVAMAQVSVAILDMADNSREALILQRAIAKNEGVSQAVAPTPGSAASANDQAAGRPPEERKTVPQAARQPLEGRESFETYMGEEIDYKDNRHHWNGQKFLTLGKAKAAIKSAKGSSA